MAAIPCVVVAYLIAAKYLGSQGSSNPIISVVMHAARTNNIAATMIFYATLAGLAPICEEILFRGFLYSALRKYWGILPSMLLSALAFAGIHLDAGGFLPLFTLGMLFAFTFRAHAQHIAVHSCAWLTERRYLHNGATGLLLLEPAASGCLFCRLLWAYGI